jgi:hypothetical protein
MKPTKRWFPAVLVVTLVLGLAGAALASMVTLTVNEISFDSRTFQYGGHVSYTYTSPYMGNPSAHLVSIITHNNSNCNSGQCGSSPHFMVKCTMTAGSGIYFHDMEAKLINNGTVVDFVNIPSCYHSAAGTTHYYAGSFLTTACTGTSGVAKYRVTIQGGAPWADQDSNDTTLN